VSLTGGIALIICLLKVSSSEPGDSKLKRFFTEYGSPIDFLPPSQAKRSNLIKVCIQHQLTGETWDKKVPRMITVQTLQGLVMKRFQLGGNVPQLCYVDAQHPDLVVPLDNNAKTLDFYSVQEHDTVLVQ